MHLKVPTINDQDVILDILHEEMTEFDGVHDVLFHVSGRQKRDEVEVNLKGTLSTGRKRRVSCPQVRAALESSRTIQEMD